MYNLELQQNTYRVCTNMYLHVHLNVVLITSNYTLTLKIVAAFQTQKLQHHEYFTSNRIQHVQHSYCLPLPFLLVASSEAFLSHKKRGVTLSIPISGIISPLFAYSWIDNSYYFISLEHGHLSFESLSHGTHLAILIATVCGDFISYTCIISDVVLDHDKKSYSYRYWS